MEKTSLDQCIGEIKTDIKWIKRQLSKGDKTYAKKWVEKVQYALMLGVGAWVIDRLLSLIETAHALITK